MSVEADLADLEQRMEEAVDARAFMNEHARGHAVSNDPYGHLCENQCFERALAVWIKKHDEKVIQQAMEARADEVKRIRENSLDEDMVYHPVDENFEAWLRDPSVSKRRN